MNRYASALFTVNSVADNFLEHHYEDYLRRKEDWLRRKQHLPKQVRRNIQRPEDEAL